MADHIAPPQQGQIFVLPESEYRYGVGPVVAQVLRVRGRVEYQGQPWWHVSAKVANGVPENHGGWQDRDLYLREASFRQTGRGSIAGGSGRAAAPS